MGMIELSDLGGPLKFRGLIETSPAFYTWASEDQMGAGTHPELVTRVSGGQSGAVSSSALLRPGFASAVGEGCGCLAWDGDLLCFQEVFVSVFLRLLRNSREDLALAPGPGRFPGSCSPSPGWSTVYGSSCKV